MRQMVQEKEEAKKVLNSFIKEKNEVNRLKNHAKMFDRKMGLKLPTPLSPEALKKARVI